MPGRLLDGAVAMLRARVVHHPACEIKFLSPSRGFLKNTGLHFHRAPVVPRHQLGLFSINRQFHCQRSRSLLR